MAYGRIDDEDSKTQRGFYDADGEKDGNPGRKGL